jgi:hypothetical protein
MTRRTKTMNLKGNDYAGVPDRIKEFREDCPQGKIITKHQKSDKGTIFKAYVWKNKADVHYNDAGVVLDSADATGTAESTKTGEKDFEKLETISIGRGLAILGYLASGEIASTEEMEEFNEYKQDKIDIAVATINNAETMEQLKEVFMSLGKLIAEQDVIKAKDAKKKELSDASN